MQVLQVDDSSFNCVIELEVFTKQCCPLFVFGKVQLEHLLNCLWNYLFLYHSLWEYISSGAARVYSWLRQILLQVILSLCCEVLRGPLMYHPRSERIAYGSDSSPSMTFVGHRALGQSSPMRRHTSIASMQGLSQHLFPSNEPSCQLHQVAVFCTQT